MKKLWVISIVFLLVGCGGAPEAGDFDWFEWGSEEAENLEYTALYKEVLPQIMKDYHYNQWACNAPNGFDLHELVCEFSSGTVEGKGSWFAKAVITVRESEEVARERWQGHADLYYADDVVRDNCDSATNCLSADANRIGDSLYTLHKVYRSPDGSEYHTYQKWLVYENTQIFLMEDNPFGEPVIDGLESVSRRIVDIEQGEN